MSDEIHYPPDLSDLEGPEELRVEYIKGLVETAAEDARHVTLNVSLALAVVAVFLTQLPHELVFGQVLAVRLTLFLGLLALGASAIAFFGYVRAVHYARMAIVRSLASADAKHARQLWAGRYGVWERKKRWYQAGQMLMYVGLALEALSMAVIFIRGWPLT
ncbi:hypothetical protein ACIBH1_08865 [Nonomuraea sp. NPDC050663]|uniref:hypothetical protein n=1 Tax=Nonomuraea sp. NPDC050663 TaxID=3364370 RepID=UPI003796DAD7